VHGHADSNQNQEECYAAAQIRSQKGVLAVHFPVFYDNMDGIEQNIPFCVFYSELLTWKQSVIDFVGSLQVFDGDHYNMYLEKITSYTEAYLIRMGFPKEIVEGTNNSKLPEEMMNEPWTAEYASLTILENSYAAPLCFEGTNDWDTMFSHIETAGSKQLELELVEVSLVNEAGNGDFSSGAHAQVYPPVIASSEPAPQMFINNKKVSALMQKRANVVSMFGNLMERRTRMDELQVTERSKYNTTTAVERQDEVGTNKDANSSNVRDKPLFIVYQTPNVNTGGTIALSVLYEHLLLSGSNALLCHEANEYQNRNYNSSVCWNPPPNAIVITGEWCHEVMEYYGIQHHKGRGIQYHLGFHVSGDVCSGHIALAGSHYLSNNLLDRVLSGYYLGAPMATDVQQRFENILNATRKPLMGGIAKENLVLIDTDFADDYAPESDISYEVPENARYVMLKNFSREEVLLLLQRAKVTLDLAMPGAERLSGEGVLLGSVPIIASRWNGASDIDFPGVLRVESLNGTAITEMIAYALKNYDTIMREDRHAQFYSYTMSLSERLENTLHVLDMSSSLKFVMKANDLKEETMACLLATTILYLFPLASIDIYVSDVRWFNIHHYAFLNIMYEGGGMRYSRKHNRDTVSQGKSLVQIFSHRAFNVKSTWPLPKSNERNLFSSEYNTPTTVVLLSCNTKSSRMFSSAQAFAKAAEEKLTKASLIGNTTRILHLYSHRDRERTVHSARAPAPQGSAEQDTALPLSQFAAVFPAIIGAEDSAFMERFLSAASEFFERDADETGTGLGSGDSHSFLSHLDHYAQRNKKGDIVENHVILVHDAVLRDMQELKLCQGKEGFVDATAGMDTSCDSMPSIDFLDGIRESAAWNILNTYYCNIL